MTFHCLNKLLDLVIEKKPLKFKAEGQDFANIFLMLGQNNFGNKIPKPTFSQTDANTDGCQD